MNEKDANTYDSTYVTCHGCSKRLTDGENCHTAEYCPGWAYREALKLQRYENKLFENAGAPQISNYHKRLIKRKHNAQKRGNKE